MMRAFVRHGTPSWPIPHRPHQVDDIAEFSRLLGEVNWRLRYLRWHRNKKLRTLIGPPEFNGPVYDGQYFVGEVINGRVYNSVTHLHYHCIRGMTDSYFREEVATLYRFLDHMKRCTGPVLP